MRKTDKIQFEETGSRKNQRSNPFGKATFLITAAFGKRGAFPLHLAGELEKCSDGKTWRIMEGRKSYYYQESEEGSESYHTKDSLRDSVPREQKIGQLIFVLFQ